MDTLSALVAFAETRPGIDWRNYSNVRDYRNEAARVTRQLKDVRRLADTCRARSIVPTIPHGDRISMDPEGNISYTAGQYYCVEYRAAAARILASALWNWVRTNHTGPNGHCDLDADGIRRIMRKTFGRGLASRYFN